MDLGEPVRTFIVEPVREPVPAREPAPSEPSEPAPEKTPVPDREEELV